LAVYTPLSNTEIAAFLQGYDVGELVSANGIAEGIENTNYLLVTQKAVSAPSRYILTVYEQRVAPEELPFFLDLTEFLAAQGIACPRPVRNKTGEAISALKGKRAALIEFLEGKGSPAITPEHLALVGGLMAHMHLAASGFKGTRANALSHDGWQALFRRFSARASEITPKLGDAIREELVYLHLNWPKDLPAGIIHADIFPDNVFFQERGGKPVLSGIIDFYFACHDYWMYELAITLNAWCFDETHRFVPERARSLFAAYQAVRPISAQEWKAFPVLCRGAAMRFLLTRCYDWLNRAQGALVTPKDPMEYVAKLRFHQQVKNAQDYAA